MKYLIACVRFSLAAVFILALLDSVSSQSQTQPKAKVTEVALTGFRTDGGIVNLIEGESSYFHSGRQRGELKSLQPLQNLDVIQTGDTARCEILLNPGYYLRLAANPRVVFLNLSQSNLKLKILRGSAILELVVIADPGASLPYDRPLTISTPAGEFVTVKRGIYRFDVSPTETDLRVTKGGSVVAGVRVADGMKAMLRDGKPTVVKFKGEAGDGFDAWSRERAGSLIKSNKSLKDTDWHRHLQKNPLSYLNVLANEGHGASDRYVVSALGGLVSFVEAVAYQHGQQAWTKLSEGENLEYGDRVRTGADSRAEVLIYPNCYLRLAGNTEIVYDQRPDTYAAIKVLEGSAIISNRSERKDATPISLVAREGEFEILRVGDYRLNTNANGQMEMLVYDGLARISGREIKQGHKAVLMARDMVIAELQKGSLDSFDVWSRQRRTTAPLSRRVRFLGLWFYDKARGAYTYVPGEMDFHSPYGGRYAIGFLGMFH